MASSQKIENTTALLNGYAADVGMYDEMWAGGEEKIHKHWQPFVQAFEQLGCEELERDQQEARRQFRENGVTYNVHTDPENQRRVWTIDIIPFIISQEDWEVIEEGLKQRAELLNLVLQDIYGAQTLIKQGLLPMELVYMHSGFLRQCANIEPMTSKHLFTYAADLARGPDGRMWVLSDRTQAPSGAGYALENRMVTSRVLSDIFQDSQIHRLSNYFRDLQESFSELVATSGDSQRIMLMTPGPHNETYFEHAYLASYLGYPLVQGNDLTVRDGRVALKSLDGLQPVDVILRRVDDLFCDPLELREDSLLGVAGLLEAVRRKNVTVINPLGSSVLENPALMPFIPGLAKHLLGEELILPSAATWWCGQPKEREYVLQNLDKLVIKRINRLAQSRSTFVAKLSKRELSELRDQINAQPELFTGQEQVSFSTTPSLIDGHLGARRAVLRAFLAAHKGSYTVMPGGLTRSATQPGEFIVSNQAGGVSKDTWVLTTRPSRHTSLWLQSTGRYEQNYYDKYHLPSRAAENLFWVGRYAERAEATARLLRIIFHFYREGGRLEDEIEVEAVPVLLQALTQVTMTYPGFLGDDNELKFARPLLELHAITLDTTRSGSLIFNLQSMVRAAYSVRDLWSIDTWRVIDRMDKTWMEQHRTRTPRLNQMQTHLNQTITSLMAFAGLNTESMTHESGWLLLDIGRRLERAMLTIALIRSVLVYQTSQPVEYLLLDSLLRVTENIITYQRRYRSFLQAQTVLDFLLHDVPNPRSLTYQFSRLQEHINELPRLVSRHRLSSEERIILETTTRLRLVDPATLVKADEISQLREPLDEFMAYLTAQLSQLSLVMTQTYFTHTHQPHQTISASMPGVDVMGEVT